METKDRSTTVVVVAGIIALLLGLCLGAMMGGFGGYVLGKQVGQRAATGGRPLALPEIPSLPELIKGSGVVVQSVVPGSPAADADIRPGDVLTKVNQITLDQQHPLADVLSQFKAGDSVTLTFERSGREQTVKVTLGGRTDDPKLPYLGIRYTGPGATPTP
jgi:S1-C subfamily serine protease